MPTITVTITNAPSFAGVGIGYQFTGTVSLPQVITGPIRINSMKLYYGYGRAYMSAPYLTAVCGDTTFRTDYFALSEDSTLRQRTLNVLTWTEGTDHILREDGRAITFTARRDSSTSANIIDRPRGGDMTLEITYELLFQKSEFTLNKTSVDMGTALRVTVANNALNAGFTHSAKLTLGSLSISASRTGPGTITLNVPRTAAWLALLPSAVTGTATVTLTTSGSGETGSGQTTVIVAVPDDVLPSIASLGITRIDGRVPSAWAAYIQGESKAEVTIQGAAAGTGASISSYRIQGGGYAANAATLTTGFIKNAGTVTFTATVTDSRGRTATLTASITVEAYSVPRLTSLRVWRANSSGTAAENGTYLRLRATFGYAEIYSNAPTFAVYVNGTQVTPTLTVGDGSLTAVLPETYEITRGHTVLLELRDAVTAGSTAPASLSETVPSAKVAFHVRHNNGEFGAAFGMYQEQDKRFSVPADWEIRQGPHRVTAQARNLLDNSDFTNPVNQRGLTSYSGAGYTLDRWRIWVDSCTLTRNSGYITVSGHYLYQILESYKANTVYTLAVKELDGTLTVISHTFESGGSEPTDFYLDNGLNRIRIGLEGASKNYVWAALYEGSYTAETLPEYVPKGYAAELAECMRYYQRIEGAKFSFYSYRGTEKYFFGSCNFPMVMRETPTITISTATVSGIGTLSNATPYNWNERGVYQIAVQTETMPDTHDWCSFVAECSADL